MASGQDMTMELPPMITLEEHFLSTAILNNETSLSAYSQQLQNIPGLREDLTDLGSRRITSMDESKISLQVVSHGPGQITADQARAANEQLCNAISANPTRFAGFAVLPVTEPDAMAKELAYCVEELGFVGALIDSHTANGTTFDGPEYSTFWYTVQSLGVPIYLHPTWPTDAARLANSYTPNLSPAAVASLGTSGWGWHSEVGVHVLKLFAAGVFDRYPRLKIIVGHMGEMLPFMKDRITQLSVRWGQRQRLWKDVYENNLWITTSGVWSVDPMATILRNTNIDKILYSVDYPFAKNENGLKFMRELKESNLVDKDGFEKIAYKNAEKLLGIRVIDPNEENEPEEETS